jgi:hypothetical protein
MRCDDNISGMGAFGIAEMDFGICIVVMEL